MEDFHGYLIYANPADFEFEELIGRLNKWEVLALADVTGEDYDSALFAFDQLEALAQIPPVWRGYALKLVSLALKDERQAADS